MHQLLKFLAIIVVSAILIMNYTSISTMFVNKTPKRGPDNKSLKTILYWTPLFDSKDHYLGVGQKIFENCSNNNCYATYNRSYLPDDEYDALLFHAPEFKAYSAPIKRNPRQIYIFVNLESPDNTPFLISNYNNFYNWTVTYRSDSDVVRPYGVFWKQKTGYQLPSVEEITKRRKKIAWFVSHCQTTSGREKLATRIKKIVPVDIYGKCGTLFCSVKKKDECYDMMEKEYKFYLSFENSLCENYVTEKLYNILKRNIVPIVYGGADYTFYAPPKSVINVLDFKSVENLTQYIKYLDAHPEEYLKYFEWKRDYVVDTSHKPFLCDFCKKLNEPMKPKLYGDIFRWWFGENKTKCFNNISRNIT